MTFDSQDIPLYKRILSYIHPVWIRHYKSDVNPYLELLLYRGRIQLATQEALYSDGDAYTPAQAILKDLHSFLPSVHNALVMGVGLGSMVSMAHKKGFDPHFTLVELDEVILQLAMERLSHYHGTNVTAICSDAEQFVAGNTQQYDLIFIDIFNSRTVPAFVSSLAFLSNCRKSLKKGGRVAFNYIINDKRDWEYTQKNFSSVFPDHHIISDDINRIFIGSY